MYAELLVLEEDTDSLSLMSYYLVRSFSMIFFPPYSVDTSSEEKANLPKPKQAMILS